MIPANNANPTARAANPASFTSRSRHLEGTVASHPLQLALAPQPLEVVRPLVPELLFADQPDQQRHVGGELLRPQVNGEEVDGEDESRGQQRLRGMDHLGDVQGHAGQEAAEEIGEPEDQAGRADDDDVGAGAPEVELLPIGPALEAGLRPQAHEPAEHLEEVLHVAPVGHGRIGPENDPQPGRSAAVAGGKLPHQPNHVDPETGERHQGEHAMPEARRFKAAQAVRQRLGPIVLAVLQRQAGQRQTEERHQQDGMRPPMHGHEPHVGRLAGHQALRPPFAEHLHQAAHKPEHGVQPEEPERRQQQRQQHPVDPIDNGIVLGIVVVDVRIELGEIGRGMRMALLARRQAVFGGNARAGSATARMLCGAVAVVAVGRRLVAQLRQFAVDAHRIAAGQIGVAIAAEVGQLLAESRRRGQGDFVSLVAGGAAWPLLRFSARRQPFGHFARPRARP